MLCTYSVFCCSAASCCSAIAARCCAAIKPAFSRSGQVFKQQFLLVALHLQAFQYLHGGQLVPDDASAIISSHTLLCWIMEYCVCRAVRIVTKRSTGTPFSIHAFNLRLLNGYAFFTPL